jgi:hypothetical protein
MKLGTGAKYNIMGRSHALFTTSLVDVGFSTARGSQSIAPKVAGPLNTEELVNFLASGGISDE